VLSQEGDGETAEDRKKRRDERQAQREQELKKEEEERRKKLVSTLCSSLPWLLSLFPTST
jgi:hypothetical protein